jgi:hypothetical protein
MFALVYMIQRGLALLYCTKSLGILNTHEARFPELLASIPQFVGGKFPNNTPRKYYASL